MAKNPRDEFWEIYLYLQDNLKGYVNQFPDGGPVLEAKFEKELLDTHSAVYKLGVALADGTLPSEDVVKGLIGLIVDEERDFYTKFSNELSEGKYKGSLEEAQRRAELYSRKLVGTANRAFVDASDPEESYDWILGAAEHHCSDCPALANSSPIRAADLWTVPGAGETECSIGCKCYLVRSDGVQGFGNTEDE